MFFDQTAERAALLFTEKANVTATLALAGIGFTATRVQFWADPGVNKSIHRIEAAGACGTLSIDWQTMWRRAARLRCRQR